MPSTDPGAPVATNEPSRLWRATFGASLAFAAAAGTVMQFTLSALGPLLVDDLELSRAELGTLSTVFFATAAICSIPAGHLVDRLGGARMVLIHFGVAGGSLVALSLAPSLAWLWLAVAAAGVANGTMNPVTNDLIATHVRAGRQAVTIGVKQSGVQVGAFLAGMLLPPIAAVTGWRTTVLVSGLMVLAGASSRLLVARRIRPKHADPTSRPPPLSRLTKGLTAYALLMGFAYSSVIAYLPLFAFDSIGMTSTSAGMLTGVMGFVGIVARIILARVAEHYGDTMRVLTVIAAAAAGVQALMLSSMLIGPWVLWPAAIGFGLTAAAWNSVAMLAVIREAQGSTPGKATGVVNGGFLLGLMGSPVLAGWSMDRTDGYTLTWVLITGVFAAAAAVSWRWRRQGVTV